MRDVPASSSLLPPPKLFHSSFALLPLRDSPNPDRDARADVRPVSGAGAAGSGGGKCSETSYHPTVHQLPPT
jgi:hypothetical protein